MKIDKAYKEIFFSLLGFLGIYLLWYYSERYYKLEHELLLKHGKSTVGTIRLGLGIVHCKYQVKGKLYSHTFYEPHGLVNTGEKYKVLYDSANPDNFWIFYEHPILEPVNEFKEIKLDKIIKNKEIIEFEYHLASSKYSRYQIIPEEVVFDSSKTYKAYYNILNPKIAYVVWK